MKNNHEVYSFIGHRCCIFENETIEDAIKSMRFETIKEYGNKFLNEDGSVKHFLHTWDEGERELVRCNKCGAYFIKQDSEFHGLDDTDYTDWYQVENPDIAEKLNEIYNGWELEKKYSAPGILRTNGKYHWNKE